MRMRQFEFNEVTDMTTRQKWIRSAVSGALLAAMLVGCGGSSNSDPVTPPPPPAQITGVAIPSNVSVVTATNSN